ncbi:hypothetical protein KQX54_018022 [Cotesia glomerata]|uniref:Uncharacterized protein n=1 Tax=Cotesia glomerata TaxID=32391 RepID=A0AAV7ICW9_COTGL|nr:hypothetical protein KQX54_018022 [Cotesia glomerata]
MPSNFLSTLLSLKPSSAPLTLRQAIAMAMIIMIMIMRHRMVGAGWLPRCDSFNIGRYKIRVLAMDVLWDMGCIGLSRVLLYRRSTLLFRVAFDLDAFEHDYCFQTGISDPTNVYWRLAKFRVLLRKAAGDGLYTGNYC